MAVLAPPPATHESQAGLLAPFRIDVVNLRKEIVRRDTTKVLLNNVSFAVQPGELVAIVGGSGAGKTTLLTAMAGVASPSSGRVLYNGREFDRSRVDFRESIGYVPQDDIVHKELSVRRTLEYAARLRLPSSTTRAERRRIVTETLAALHLTDQADQSVGSLSGGQRKRVSIGVELLTGPGVFFLDEPTSGLDPATGQEMMRLLRELADAGSTVILTTHAPQDIASCSRVVFLARGGHLAFEGSPADALDYFEVEHFYQIYGRLAEQAPEEWATRFAWAQATRPRDELDPGDLPPPPPVRRAAGFFAHWLLLTQRNFEIMARNTLTLAILAGAPILVIAMFAVLFRPGAFDPADPSPSATIMIVYWVAFGAFFFGLTYGLLQICTEFSIFHRERLVNLQVLPYVLSKLTVLLPILAAVVVLMLSVLRLFDRMPAEGMDVYGSLTVTLLLDGVAAIALGLLASAAVSRPEQATLALPMICFPAVLFSGAILPVPIMADAGEVISLAMTDKWAFDAVGNDVGLNELFRNGSSPLGPPLLESYGDTFSQSVPRAWGIMALMTVVYLAATWAVLRLKRPAFA